MGKQVVCTMYLRPRANGTVLEFPAGTPLDEDLIDAESRQIMLDKGTLSYVEEPIAEETPTVDKRVLLKERKAEALEKYGVELKGVKFNTVEKVAAEIAQLEKAAKAPKGIFKVSKADLEGFNIDELDAMHADICATHELSAPVPFESVEQGIAQLSGEQE